MIAGAEKRYDKLSIISFVLGLLSILPVVLFGFFNSFVFFLWVISMVMGFISLHRIRKNKSLKGEGLAIASILLILFFAGFLISIGTISFGGGTYEVTGDSPLYLNFDLNTYSPKDEYYVNLDIVNRSASNYPAGNSYQITRLLPKGTRIKIKFKHHYFGEFDSLPYEDYTISVDCSGLPTETFDVPTHECGKFGNLTFYTCQFNTSEMYPLEISCEGSKTAKYHFYPGDCQENNRGCSVFENSSYFKKI